MLLSSLLILSGLALTLAIFAICNKIKNNGDNYITSASVLGDRIHLLRDSIMQNTARIWAIIREFDRSYVCKLLIFISGSKIDHLFFVLFLIWIVSLFGYKVGYKF